MRKIFNSTLLLLFAFSLLSLNGFAQDNYRTLTSGAWNGASTWEKDVAGNGSYSATSTAPTATNSIQIFINAGDAVNIPSGYSVTADQIFLDAYGELDIDAGGTLDLVNGSGTDLDIYNDGIDYAFVNVSGTLKGEDLTTINGSGSNLAFLSGGKYQHYYTTTEGLIPSADWDVNSTCEVLGYTTFSGTATIPGNWGQTFGNFTYNCTNQAAGKVIDFNNLLTTIKGNLIIASTGSAVSSRINLSSTGSFTLSIDKNFEIQNSARVLFGNTSTVVINIVGDFIINSGSTGNQLTGTGTTTVNVTGNFSMAAGAGKLIMVAGTGAGTGTLNIRKNFTLTSGTITNTSTGTALGNINFTGTTVQNFISTGTISGKVNYSVSTLASLDLKTSALTGGGTFTLNNKATLYIGSPQGIQTGTTNGGNIQLTTTPNYVNGSTIIYNGLSIQELGPGYPPSPAQINLTINNPSNVFINGYNFTVNASSVLTLQSGNFLLQGNTLIIDGNIAGTGAIDGSGGSSVSITGSVGGNAGTIRFTPTGSSLLNFSINRSGGSAVLGSNLTVTGVLAMTNGTLVVNNQTLTLSGTVTGSGTLSSSAGTFTQLSINGGGSLGSLNFLGGANTIKSLTLNRSSSGSATIGSALVIDSALTLTNGVLTATSLTLSNNSTLTRDVGTLGTLSTPASTGYNLIYTSPVTTSLELPAAGSGTTSLKSMTINSTSGSVVLDKASQVNGNITISTGTFDAASFNIALTGNFINNSTFVPNTGSVTFSGSSLQNISGTNATSFYDLIINNSSNVSLAGTGVTTTVSNFFTTLSGALVIGPNTLGLNGTIPISGSIIGGITSNLSIGGSGNLGSVSFASSPSLNNLTLNRTASGQATLSNTLTTYGKVTLTAGTLNSNGNLIVNLNSGYISGSGLGAISGNINTVKAITRPGYTYVGSDVINSSVNFPSNGYFYYYNESVHDRSGTGTDPGWTAVSLTGINVNSSNIMRGYAAYYPTVPLNDSLTGSYNHVVDYSISVTNTAVSGNAPADNGMNLVCNPYPSALDWISVDRSTNDVANELHYYSGSVYNSFVGSFPSGGNIIPPGQGVVIFKNNPGTSTLTFPKSARLDATKSYYRVSADVENTNALKITLSDGNFSDATYLRYLPNATKAFDSELDAHKFFNDANLHSLYTTLSGTDFSINTIPFENITIPLKYYTPNGGNFKLNFSQYYPIDPSMSLTLYDKYLGKSQDIIANPDYTLNIASGDTNTRLFLNVATTITSNNLSANSNFVKIRNNNNLITTDFLSTYIGTANITVTNLVGQIVYNENHNLSGKNETYTFPLDSKEHGIYIVKIQTGNAVYSDKISIEY